MGTRLRQASHLSLALRQPPCLPGWTEVAQDARDRLFGTAPSDGSSDAGGPPTAAETSLSEKTEGACHSQSFEENAVSLQCISDHSPRVEGEGGEDAGSDAPLAGMGSAHGCACPASSNVREGVRHTGACPASVQQRAEAWLSVSVLRPSSRGSDAGPCLLHPGLLPLSSPR